MSNKYEEGMRTRRSVLGDAWVDKAEGNKTPFDADFQQYITENAWGSVWNRPGLTPRERSMMTISLLTALGHYDELALHLQACKNTGTSLDDVREVLLHSAVYAGIPAANHAFKVAKDVLFKKDDSV
jgi:4-carboxymuconolactone decarboxylase